MVAGWLVVVNVAPHTAFEMYGWWYSGAITVKLFKYDNENGLVDRIKSCV